jgi:hypothetical protein
VLATVTGKRQLQNFAHWSAPAAFVRPPARFVNVPAGFRTAVPFRSSGGRGERQHRQTMDDMGAELQLRGLEPPVHLVEKTMENIQQRIRDMPGDARNGARDAIGDFIIKMDKPKH